MFVPSHYREPDGSWMVDLIRDNPLALAAINGSAEDGPFATHLPVIPDPRTSGEWTDGLTGATLLGHMNRANPHWRTLETGDTILLAFTGPHAYVSPSVYEVTPAAPTWNFTSVHVRGVVQKIDSLEETLDVVRATALAFEGRFGAGWDQSESLDYFRRIVPGVGAFRVTVSRAEGMFKLSQEQPAAVRERVQKSFGGSECTRHRETAELMGRLPRTGP
ncbi:MULTISPECIES: FMN-binding negative transcriptional regulator [Streptomyces]|uniref:FMN-binding negative transcriptional regulator n=1 Tax=Streptomyces TaxID=1883 RepID=UPI0022A9B513|nr:MULTISPECIES: FMN-binding negative transcriptional regulator [Streptomyces]UFQ18657.1 FMN-binding negative transcriptional regulator [Streptomyces huasconensis]WCL88273.1 FMN-binding negative transcriptional regulator [Streptomyces sp. JCM 35825]